MHKVSFLFLFTLKKSNLSVVFLLWTILLTSYLRNLCIIQGHEGFCLCFLDFFFFRFYLFIFREMGREGNRKGEKHQCVRDTFSPVASGTQTPKRGPDLQPRHVP